MQSLHRLTILSTISILSLATANPPASARDIEWEYQGIASTGERVNLDLNSIAVDPNSIRFDRPPVSVTNYSRSGVEIFETLTQRDSIFIL